MEKKKFRTSVEFGRENSSVNAWQYVTPEEFIRAAGTYTASAGPKGTMRLVAHLNGEHHIKLQIVAQRRRLTLAQLLEEMIDQLPEPD